jgi:hypothetical protein
MDFKTYSIDDVIKYSKSTLENLNYFVNKSEGYLKDISSDIETTLYKLKFNNPKVKTQYNINGNYNTSKTITYYFTPKIFLKPKRPKTRFISLTEDVQNLIEETFELVTNQKLPENISIRVCNNEEFKQIHSEFELWSDNVQGFAINNKKLKKIFVKNAHLDELMLTIGHEIGHVFTKNLSNKHDEEAKAFSFAVKWAETIRKHNIGNLSCCIKENFDFMPAKNGLHDIPFLFVKNLINKGIDSIHIHYDLVKGYISLWGFYG